MTATQSYHPISAWWEDIEDVQPRLSAEIKCDVVIIGGGYTGLSAALSLQAEGLDVVILEQSIAGSGSSGRNAGHLTPTIGKDYASLFRFYGVERARSILKFAEDAVEYAETLIREYQIDCDYVGHGNIMAAVHSSHERSLRKSIDEARALGANVEFLDAQAMADRGIPAAFKSGILDRAGGILNPGKLVRALRRKALDSGVKIYENSPVSELVDGEPARAICSGGTVQAKNAILATNAYTPELNWLRRKQAPVVVTLMETEALSQQQMEDLQWSNREGIYTAHEILESYRLTSRNTIVAGSKQIKIPFRSKLISTNRPHLFRRTHKAFRDRFPELKKIEVKTYWGGYIGITVDFLPLAGQTGRHGNIHYAMAYAGHGLAQALRMGPVLKASVLGHDDPVADVLRRKAWSWPIEPFRWLGGQLLRGALTAVDARIDRKIRRANMNNA